MPPTHWLRGRMDPSHTCGVNLPQDHAQTVRWPGWSSGPSQSRRTDRTRPRAGRQTAGTETRCTGLSFTALSRPFHGPYAALALSLHGPITACSLPVHCPCTVLSRSLPLLLVCAASQHRALSRLRHRRSARRECQHCHRLPPSLLSTSPGASPTKQESNRSGRSGTQRAITHQTLISNLGTLEGQNTAVHTWQCSTLNVGAQLPDECQSVGDGVPTAAIPIVDLCWQLLANKKAAVRVHTQSVRSRTEARRHCEQQDTFVLPTYLSPTA